MINLPVDKFLRLVAHTPGASDETKEQYILHVQQQRKQRSTRRVNRKACEQDREALNIINEYYMNMEYLSSGAVTKDLAIINAAKIILSIIDNSLQDIKCGTGDAHNLNLVLSAFDVIESANVAGAMKKGKDLAIVESHIIKSAIMSEEYSIISEDKKTIRIKTTIPNNHEHIFNVRRWYFDNLCEECNMQNRGKKFAPGKKPKKDNHRQALADDWIARYRECRKHYDPHDATKEANQYIAKNWDADRYGKQIGNQQIKNYVNIRLKEAGNALN